LATLKIADDVGVHGGCCWMSLDADGFGNQYALIRVVAHGFMRQAGFFRRACAIRG
jgi:hypothetical protein